jgi:hypothetical protein
VLRVDPGQGVEEVLLAAVWGAGAPHQITTRNDIVKERAELRAHGLRCLVRHALHEDLEVLFAGQRHGDAPDRVEALLLFEQQSLDFLPSPLLGM